MRDSLSWPIPVSERISILYIERESIERDGHALVAVSGARRTVIPVGKTSAIFLGPGSTLSHAAAALCTLEQTLLIWVGEAGVRLYTSANPLGNPDRVLRQAPLHLDPVARLGAARAIFRLMFGEEAPPRRSVEQLRGLEGAKVKQILRDLTATHGISWNGRNTSGDHDAVSLAISTATAALYGLSEAVILALGYSPAIGFVHSGAPRSFVFDLADTVKFRSVVPLAVKLVAASPNNLEKRVRTACRDLFVSTRMASTLVENTETILYADDRD